jgi:WD40 repeat protein/uncharacterized caspase-like protein/tetratricopeptide (TPR) repeat protein
MPGTRSGCIFRGSFSCMRWMPSLIVILVLQLGVALGGEVVVLELPKLRPPPTDYRAKWAVIIGVDDYSAGDGFQRLTNAANDARALRQMLVGEFGYDDSHVLYLTDSKEEPARIVADRPSLTAVRDAFEKWLPAQDMRPDDSLLVFFAGHGLRDAAGQAYLAAAGSKSRDPASTCVSLTFIRNRLGDRQTVKSRHVLILLDCCFSGGLFMFNQPLAARSSNPPSAMDKIMPLPSSRSGAVAAFQIQDEIAYYLAGEAYVGMTAGLGEQPVTDGSGRDHHSLFTKALLEAMRDRANSPRAEHVFTFSELASMVRQLVAAAVLRRDTLVAQIPMAGRIDPGEGDFLFHQTVNREAPWERAARDERRAVAENLANLADRVEPIYPERRVLLATEGILSRLANDQPNPSAESSLRRAIDAIGGNALVGNSSHINGLVFTHDGKALVGTTVTHQLCLWNAGALNAAGSLTPSGQFTAASFVVSPRGDHAAAFDRDGTMLVWKLKGGNIGTPVRVLPQLALGPYSQIVFSPDGKWMVTVNPTTLSKAVTTRARFGSGPVDVAFYSLPNLSPSAKAVTNVTLKALPIRFSPGGQLLISGGENEFHDEVQVVDLAKLATPKVLPKVEGTIGMQVMATSLSGRWIITKEARYSPRLEVARLWDSRDWREFTLHTYKGEDALFGLDSAYISNDAKWAATGTRKVQTIWNLDATQAGSPTPIKLPSEKLAGKKENEFYDDIRILGFTPDGRHLLTEGMYFAKIWNLDNRNPAAGARLITPDDGKKWARTDKVLISNSFVIDGKRDGTIDVWDVRLQSPQKRVLKGHEGSVDGLAMNGDGRWLASYATGVARLWDLSAPDPSDRGVLAPSSGASIAISPNKRWLAAVSGEGALCLSRLDLGDPADHFWRLSSPHGRATAVAISPTSQRVAWAINRKGVVVSDLGQGDVLNRLALYPSASNAFAAWGEDQSGKTNEISRIQFSNDGLWLAGVHADGVTQLWHLEPSSEPTASRILEINVPSPAKSKTAARVAKFRRDLTFAGSGWLIGVESKCVYLFRLAPSGNVRAPVALSHTSEILRAVASADGRWLLTSTVEFGQRARIHELGPGDEIFSKDLGGKDERIHEAQFTRDGTWLITLGKDPAHRERVLHNDIPVRNAEAVRLWKVPNVGGTWESVTLIGHAGQISKLLLAPDHRSLFTMSTDRTIRRWTLETAFRQPDKCDVFSGHREQILEMAIDDSAHWLAATDATRECLAWTLGQTGYTRNPIRMFTRTPSSVIYFIPQGLLVGNDIVIAGNILWRLSSGDRSSTSVTLPVPEAGFSASSSTVADAVAILDYGRIFRVLLRDQDLLTAAKRSAGRNFTFGESKSAFPSLDYKVTFPDLPVHDSYEFAYMELVNRHIANAERRAEHSDMSGCEAEYDAGLATVLNMSHGKLCYQYAVTSFCSALLPQALRAAEHAADLVPADSEALDLLAFCQVFAGQREQAVDSLQKAGRLATASMFSDLRAKCLYRVSSPDTPPQSCVPINDVIAVLPWPSARKAEVLLVRSIVLASADKRDEAREAVKAASIWARDSHNPSICNTVCWQGSLYGFAAEVQACGEFAWKQTHEIEYLDTLALAKALLGDRQGAIDDFARVLLPRTNQGERIAKRSLWLKELRAGRSPFDDATLRLLRQGEKE